MTNEIIVKNGYALFWGQWPSNWMISPFVINSATYNCVEQYMMAEKAKCCGDFEALARIMASPDPSDQKRHGRNIQNYDEEKWSAIRYSVVLRATIRKYNQNPDLMKKLMSMGDVTFVECSPEDVIWGIGMRASDPRATDPSQWLGTNLLGKAVTEARDFFKKSLLLEAEDDTNREDYLGCGW